MLFILNLYVNVNNQNATLIQTFIYGVLMERGTISHYYIFLHKLDITWSVFAYTILKNFLVFIYCFFIFWIQLISSYNTFTEERLA